MGVNEAAAASFSLKPIIEPPYGTCMFYRQEETGDQQGKMLVLNLTQIPTMRGGWVGEKITWDREEWLNSSQ